MRTLRLSEHEPVRLRLSAHERRELRSLPSRLLAVTALHDGTTRVAPRNWVGTVALPSLRLVVRPKVDVRNVLFLLAYARRIHWCEEDFAYDTDDLVQAIAWWFDREAERAARLGLPRDYVDREEPVTTIRGRIALGRQLATRPGQRMPIECRFQEFDEDVALNRVVKAAHEALLRLPDLDGGLRRRLRHRARHVLAAVAGVAPASDASSDAAMLRRHPEWRSTCLLARLILCGRALHDGFGDVEARAFTLDMNLLFQQFVAEVVRERLAAAGDVGTLVDAGELRLAEAGERADGAAVPAVTVLPDLVVRRGGRALAVADVKYKVPPSGAWEPTDAYQLVTYCVRLGLEQGLLVYCGARPLGRSALVGTSLALATVGVDLGGTPGELLASARGAADALVAQAAATARAEPRSRRAS